MHGQTTRNINSSAEQFKVREMNLSPGRRARSLKILSQGWRSCSKFHTHYTAAISKNSNIAAASPNDTCSCMLSCLLLFQWITGDGERKL